MSKYLNYVKTKRGYSPSRAYKTDAGFDLTAVEECVIKSHHTVTLSLDISVEIPKENVGLILGRSSVSSAGILCHTGVIDAGYTGIISAVLTNLTDLDFQIFRGQRIAQLVVVPLMSFLGAREVLSLKPSERGAGGFGSTGDFYDR